MDLKFQVESKADQDLIRFLGHINEDAEVVLAELLSQISREAIFNFKGIESINSCGVRAWINFLREAEKKALFSFEECTADIVSQINMIPNFRSKSKIHSVYAAYVCEACGDRHSVLFSEGVNLPRSLNDSIEKISCPKCSETMEMEELEEEFFSWIGGA
jgi:hypothetical protein